jgi:hypothetical protein
MFKKTNSQDAIEAYLDESAHNRRSAIVPWIFAVGGTGVMLLGAFGSPKSFESNQLLMMLGGSACEAIGIAWLAPAAVRKVFSSPPSDNCQ